jgi:hypothetical protein
MQDLRLHALPEELFGCRDIRQAIAEVAAIATGPSSEQAPHAGRGGGLASRRELLPTLGTLLVTLVLMGDAPSRPCDAIGSHGCVLNGCGGRKS